MNYVIDRRLNSRHKNTVNRQRFLKRYKKQIKRAVDDAVDNRSITDMNRGEEISVPNEDLKEPVFRHGEGGTKNTVYPGNKEFVAGDKVKRPEGGAGTGSGDASASGQGEDEFSFHISQAEFLDVMFDDLALPNLVRKNLMDTDSYKLVQAGYSNDGVPARMNIVRTMRSAQSRRLALTGKSRRRLKEVTRLLEEQDGKSSAEFLALLEEQHKLRAKIARVPFLDDFDLKYNLHTKQPQPSNKAVMFCVMDVSGSMDQSRKDMAKRFFILLYLFLQRNYEKTEVVFIRHHTHAAEVDEEAFFYSRETGGTIVSSALYLLDEVIKTRYNPEQWNIYGAQATDGDNWHDDSPRCAALVRKQLLPVMNHFAYVEITHGAHQALWYEYEAIAKEFPQQFAMKQVLGPADIFKVFKELFQRQSA